MFGKEGSSISSPGFSGGFSGGGHDFGGKVCYTNSDSSFTTCVSGSNSNKGEGKLGFTFRF